MNPYKAYRQPETHMTRIDLILALYNGVIGRLEQGLLALQSGDTAAARTVLARAQLILAGMASALDASYGDLPRNLFQLYEFAVNCISEGTLQKIEAALRVLKTLREGFEGIHEEATELERKGDIPPVIPVKLVEAVA